MAKRVADSPRKIGSLINNPIIDTLAPKITTGNKNKISLGLVLTQGIFVIFSWYQQELVKKGNLITTSSYFVLIKLKREECCLVLRQL